MIRRAWQRVRFAAWALGAAYCGLFICAVQPSSAEVSARKFTIGVVIPLTGDASTFGLDMRDALQFANQQFAGGRHRLIFEDGKCSPKEAASIAQKLITVDQIDFAIGFGCSGEALGAAPIFERHQVPMMVIGGSSPKISEAGPHVFRTFPSDAGSAELLAAHIAKRHRAVAIVSSQSDYPQDLLAAFVASPAGKQLSVEREDYLPGTVDFRPMVLRVRGKQPSALFLNTQTEIEFINLLKTARGQGLEVPIYGAYWCSTPLVLELKDGLAEGIECVETPGMDAMLDSAGRSLYSEYLKTFPPLRSLAISFVSSLNGFRALIEAAQAAAGEKGSTRANPAMLAYLSERAFAGVGGEFRFDDRGDIVGLGFVMAKVSGGKVMQIH